MEKLIELYVNKETVDQLKELIDRQQAVSEEDKWKEASMKWSLEADIIHFIEEKSGLDTFNEEKKDMFWNMVESIKPGATHIECLAFLTLFVATRRAVDDKSDKRRLC